MRTWSSLKYLEKKRMNTLLHVLHQVALSGHTALCLLQCCLFYSREESVSSKLDWILLILAST